MDFIWNNWFILSLALNYVVALGAAFFLIRTNQDPHKTLTSLLLLLALPYAGLVIYWFFGLEYRKEKLFDKKEVKNHQIVEKWEDRLSFASDKLDDMEDDIFGDQVKMIKLLKKSSNARVSLKNKVDLIVNGGPKIDRLVKDLEEAKNHIHLEYYIIGDDKHGSRVIDALIAASERGVAVKVIYDSVGHELSRKSISNMKEAGIKIHSFMPVLFSRFTRKANYRNHRKIAIIDGRIAYLGGINLSDEYVNDPLNRDGIFWRDTHLRIEGHAVKSIQLQWLLNWFFVCGKEEEEVEESFFPDIDMDDHMAVQIAASGPDSDWSNIQHAMFQAIANAKERVWITTPYLIPNEAILEALRSTALRGVEIMIIVPKLGDSWAARYAARSYFQELMETGIDIQMYCKGMIHAKTMIVDDNFTTIGTSNMDYRSFNINFEMNALIFDKEFTKEVEGQFHKDLEECEKLQLDRWLDRPKAEKIKESLCRLWAPML